MDTRHIRTKDEKLVTQDAFAELPPTAQRILRAARKVLARQGFAGLTFEAIAKEAGENKASIRYHFGSKAGLITALADSVVHDENVKLRKLLSGPVDDRVDTLVQMHRRTILNLRQYRLFFDLFPNLIRDRTLWPRMAELFRWYRELDAWAMAPDADPELRQRLEVFGALTVAVCDGLAMQHAADPGHDLAPAFELYERILRRTLADIEDEAARGDGGPAA